MQSTESFSLKVKNEICVPDLEDICCVRAELAGLVCFAAQISDGLIKINTESHEIARRAPLLVKRLYNLDMEITPRQSGIYNVSLCGSEVIKVLRDTRLAGIPLSIDGDVVRRECCKRAFIRGAFLGGGSITAPEKAYHIEFVTHHFAIRGDFANILEYFSVSPKVVNRGGNCVFYIKDSEQIADTLTILGAHSRMMDFLNVKIEKDLRNITNRRVNCENANSEKSAGAAVAQAQAIRKLEKSGRLESLPEHLVDVARLRLEFPEATLADIAAKLGITKSGVNHRMRKIAEISEEC